MWKCECFRRCWRWLATGQEECFPKFRVIRALDDSLWYFFVIRMRIPYDHDTTRGYCLVVN